MNALANRAMNQYKQVGTKAKADTADPHQLIVMLYDGALERIAVAKGAIERNSIEEKGKKISSAIAIVNGLIASLDRENGGEIAENLEALYHYMIRRLMDANLSNECEPLDEVINLLKEVRAAWVAIPLEERMVASA